MTISLRKARLEDAQFLLDLRNDPEVRRASRNMEVIFLDTHTAWLRKKLGDPNTLLYIAGENGVPLGQVRFDIHEEEAEISVALVADFRGKGYGSTLITEATALFFSTVPAAVRVNAVINLGNEASAKSFAKAGYAPKGEIDEEGVTRQLFVFEHPQSSR